MNDVEKVIIRVIEEGEKPKSTPKKALEAEYFLLGVVAGIVVRVLYEVLTNGKPFSPLSVLLALFGSIVALGLAQGLLEQFKTVHPVLKFMIGFALGFTSELIG